MRALPFFCICLNNSSISAEIDALFVPRWHPWRTSILRWSGLWVAW